MTRMPLTTLDLWIEELPIFLKDHLDSAWIPPVGRMTLVVIVHRLQTKAAACLGDEEAVRPPDGLEASDSTTSITR